jgi:hypothetical protein
MALAGSRKKPIQNAADPASVGSEFGNLMQMDELMLKRRESRKALPA